MRLEITLEALTFETIIGVLPCERTTPQRIVVDCVLGYDYADGAYIDYADVASSIRDTVIRGDFRLIEEALETIATTLKTAYPALRTLALSIKKPDILDDAVAGVRLALNF